MISTKAGELCPKAVDQFNAGRDAGDGPDVDAQDVVLSSPRVEMKAGVELVALLVDEPEKQLGFFRRQAVDQFIHACGLPRSVSGQRGSGDGHQAAQHGKVTAMAKKGDSAAI